MAGTSEMLQELIRAHVTGDGDRFRKIAMQVAAREARSGHRIVASRIRDLLDEEPATSSVPTPLARSPRDLKGLLDVRYPTEDLTQIVLEGESEQVISRVLREHRATGPLESWGLTPRRRLLFHGPPGCGKTLGAAVLAGELRLPLLRIRVETLFSRFMGETASMLAEIFEHTQKQRGVYLFDEFDAVGKQRLDSNDVGEARRIVSTFLQLLDSDVSNSVIIAATNERQMLDPALIRRFDDVALFDLPSNSALLKLYKLRTASHPLGERTLATLARQSSGMTYADVTRAIVDAVKSMVLDGRKRLTKADLETALEEMSVRRLSN